MQDVHSSEIAHKPDPVLAEKKKRLLATAGRDAYLFKFSADNLADDPRRVHLMADLCVTFPELNHLRVIKEEFEAIYEADTREEAERRYKAWKDFIPPKPYKQSLAWQGRYGVRPGQYEHLRGFVDNVDAWHKEIFNHFESDARVTNSTTEGLNNFIERLNRIGNGLSFERLRAKAIYYHLATRRPRYNLVEK